MRRRCFYLMGHTPAVGAALTVVGAIGIEGPDAKGVWTNWVSWIPLLPREITEGWEEDVETARAAGVLDEALVDEWIETANGITREIAEVDCPEAPTLPLAVEVLVDAAMASAGA